MRSTGLALRRRASFVVAESLGLILLADWLFDSDALGVNVALFCIALAIAVLLRGGAAWRTWPGRLLLVALCGLVVALMRQPNPVTIAMSVVGLAALAIVDRQGWSATAVMRAGSLASFAANAATRPFRDSATVLRWRRSLRVQHGAARPVAALLLRWVLPLVLATLFIALFAVANPVISQWLSSLSGMIDLPAQRRVMLWLIVGNGAWALLRGHARSGLKRSGAPRTSDPSSQPSALERVAGWDWITPSLILFNAIFAVQSALDLFYLLGRAELPDGVTYAQYAHRGAYPLMITALLAGWFVLVTFRPGGLAERHTLTRWLVQLWIAQNILLTCSALWRLSMYVDVYSLTRLRVAAALWMLLVAIGLVLLIVRIARGRSNRWLLNATTWATLCILYVSSFIGFRRFIAEYNVDRCAELARPTDPALALPRVPLDIAYLESLGPDALPALHRYVLASNGANVSMGPDFPGPSALADSSSGLESSIGTRPVALAAIHRLEVELDDDLADWRGWTFNRAALLHTRPLRWLPATAMEAVAVPAR